MKRFLCLPLLVVVPFLPVRHANATTSSSINVSTTAHGMRLTLGIPQRSYPRNALIRVGLRLTNLSHRNMPLPHLDGSEGPCTNTVMEVFNDKGIVLYPPAIQTKPGEPPLIPPPCPMPETGGRQLHPGQTATGNDLEILRARNLHATMYLSGVTRVRTPTLQLLLTPSRPLGISVSLRPGQLSASVQPTPMSHQTLYVNEVSNCYVGGTISYFSGGWVPQVGRSMHPDCANPLFWYAVAGYVGQPVGTIDYVRPKH
jgi:hypothetical protein